MVELRPVAVVVLLCSLLAAPLAAPGKPVPVRLASGGRALFRVVTGPSASPRVQKAAGDLAAYLGRIGGTDFKVRAGEAAGGIAVGLPADFPSRRASPAERRTCSARTRPGCS